MRPKKNQIEFKNHSFNFYIILPDTHRLSVWTLFGKQGKHRSIPESLFCSGVVACASTFEIGVYNVT